MYKKYADTLLQHSNPLNQYIDPASMTRQSTELDQKGKARKTKLDYWMYFSNDKAL